ncbi:hypothetical protein WH47_11686 [Habropoda laboriosa]|uniref:Receptor ligand binding region domain-containing protein n=1 Tax=Habropoda laboriosa TaxID=597456 RepID=A0A0L7R878_9HYME|nr:PREDICTED: uncharacterized protein LOC108570813 [Habropoda laboriosa]KOC67033.1 hypothetical protein WH47_11686 [Habropoda laboriosa]
MGKFRGLLVIIGIICACTCGGRTECGNHAQISLLTSIHDDPSCRKLSARGVLLYEAAKLLVETHNNKSSNYDIELTVLDTCGSIAGALKAAMRALVGADTNCLQPPYYLGIIGPDTATNAEAVHKITSVLKVPHIVRRESNSPYLHHLIKESDSYLVQGTLKVVEELKWKSFTLVVNADEDGEDDAQNIAKKLTMAAIHKGLCVLVYDGDADDLTTHVVHIGSPEEDFFSKPVNGTVLVVSEGRLEEHLNHINSTNTILLLEDSRNEFTGLEAKVEKSKWWSSKDGGKYDTEELREVRWLEDAIKVYAKALDTLCKKKKCKNPVNAVDWNNVLSNVIADHVKEAQSTAASLELSMKVKASELQTLGTLVIHKNKVKLHWGDEENGEDGKDGDNDDDDDDDDDEEEEMPKAFKKLITKEKGTRTGCATTPKEIKLLHEDDDEAAQVLVSEMDNSEWWTMVGTVSGVGVAMFVVGILAVYVVYTNIRGPVPPKNARIERDTSLRRVGSDREPPARAPRHARTLQRRDSNRSIRSTISEKSV